MSTSVYFVQAGDDGPIKIGLATSVEARIKQLQSACPHKLNVLLSIPGTRGTERKMHQRFAAHRLSGEWFKPSRIIMRFISVYPPPVVGRADLTPLLKPREAAERIGCGRSTLCDLEARGELVPLRITPKMPRYPADEVAEYLARAAAARGRQAR